MVKHIIEYNVCVGDEVRFERMDGMFQYVSGCFKVFQVYFPICSTMGRIVGLIVSDVFLLYLGYRHKIGKIWL